LPPGIGIRAVNFVADFIGINNHGSQLSQKP